MCACVHVCVSVHGGSQQQQQQLLFRCFERGSRCSLMWYLPMCVILMRSLGWTSTPSLNHFPVTFSSDTSHLNTACSAAFTVRSAMLCRTSSSLSEAKTRQHGSVHIVAYKCLFVTDSLLHSTAGGICGDMIGKLVYICSIYSCNVLRVVRHIGASELMILLFLSHALYCFAVIFGIYWTTTSRSNC